MAKPNSLERPTVIKLAEQFQDRWSTYGQGTGILSFSERPTPDVLKQYPLFENYEDKFLEEISPDISIATWEKGAILFEEGNYLDLAFFVVQGQVEIYLNKTGGPSLSQPIFDLNRTQVLEPGDVGVPLGGSPRHATILETQIDKQRQSPENKDSIVYLSVMDFNLQMGSSVIVSDGEILGEIGALSGWPQPVTARTLSKCEVIQIKVAALRKMKRRSKDLKQWIDTIYKEKYLVSHLKQTPLFQKCDAGFLDQLAPEVELLSCEPDEQISREGDPADALYLVRSGFVKLYQKMGEGQLVVSYLSKGMTVGEVEYLIDGMGEYLFTAQSAAHAELVKIPFTSLRKVLATYPIVEKLLWESVVAKVKESGYSRKNISQSEFIETALVNGLVQGNSMLVIDLNTCTRCDDCVRACAVTHGGRPRFVREGDKYQHLLITKACYHCRDPLCLIGCPTGAIHRTNIGDVVAIKDTICIGCQACAKNCPYDAIQMHETGELWADNMMPARLRGKDQLLASKCDLCYTSESGPACVNNCPNGSAVRVGTLEEFQTLLDKYN